MMKNLYARLALLLIQPALKLRDSKAEAMLSAKQAERVSRALCALAVRGASPDELKITRRDLLAELAAVNAARSCASSGTPHRSQ